jgi:hypothetical protein
MPLINESGVMKSEIRAWPGIAGVTAHEESPGLGTSASEASVCGVEHASREQEEGRVR